MTASLFKNIAVLTNIGVLTHVILYPKITGYKLTLTSTSLLLLLLLSHFSRVSDSVATPWTVAYKAPPSMGFSRQEHWSGLPLPSPSTSLVFEN